MALMKKKSEEPVAAAAAPEMAPSEEAVAVETAPEVELEAASEAPAQDTPTEEAPVALDNSEALLSLFGAEDDGSSDRAMLVEMAGEVEITDLVDQLRTVSAALHIVQRRGS